VKRVTLVLDVDDSFAPTAVADWVSGWPSDVVAVYNPHGHILSAMCKGITVDDGPREGR
jgi:hypothetical protein